MNPLLSAICLDPLDLDARIVYADHLEEMGQGDRAEFVRVQMKLAEEKHEPALCNATGVCGACNRVMGLRRRERELLDGREYEWAGTILSDAGWQANSTFFPSFAWEWRSGFVEVIRCATADWLKHGPAIVACQPVREVVLSDKQPIRRGATADDWCGWELDLSGHEHPARLPPQIYDLLEGQAYGNTWTTTAVALSALSRAAILWARREAGYPEVDR